MVPCPEGAEAYESSPCFESPSTCQGLGGIVVDSDLTGASLVLSEPGDDLCPC